MRCIDFRNKEIRETLNNFNEIHISLDNEHIIKFAKTETIQCYRSTTNNK